MNRYGQTLTWGTATAPHLFTGVCTGYSYRDAFQRLLDDDEAGENRAMVQHSAKAAINFDAKVTDGSTDFLDLSAGAGITVSGIASGVVLVSEATERWTLNQPKTCNIQATHYPDMVQADPVMAGADLSAFTPDQSALTNMFPAATLIYSTYGMTHASGVIHEMEIKQTLTLNEDEPSPDGKILGVVATGYMRMIRLTLLSKAAAPAKGSVLAFTNAPDHAADYRIESVDTVRRNQKGQLFEIGAIWIPPFTS